jgi:hypothetical protein
VPGRKQQKGARLLTRRKAPGRFLRDLLWQLNTSTYNKRFYLTLKDSGFQELITNLFWFLWVQISNNSFEYRNGLYKSAWRFSPRQEPGTFSFLFLIFRFTIKALKNLDCFL